MPGGPRRVKKPASGRGARAGSASVAKARAEIARAAEQAVAAHLEQRGFSVVAQNLRLGALELDVVARRGPLIVVVEVRTRGAGAWTTAFGSIDSKKRRRVRHAGERLWQRRYRNDSSVERMRFDAASVSFGADGSAEVEYAEAAF
jgi:putative endonuclease